MTSSTEPTWTFTGELWLAEAEAAWAFVTLPPEVTEDVRLLSGPRPGFGSVRVEVRVGGSTWRTSVFPDRARGYVLPVKAAVRRAEGLAPGDPVDVALTLVEQ